VKRVKAVGLALGVIAFAAVTTAAASAQPSVDVSIDLSSVQAPTAVKVPDGNKLVGKFAAKGVQTYQCTAAAWKLLEPAASLTDRFGRPVILHSRGPIWVSTVDGSAVEAAPVDGARVERPNAVPELLLKAKTARGAGLLGKVSYVQRLRTEGGVAPAGACTPDALVSVPYSALYTFYAPAS
jgi:hypothetical protein